MLRKLRSKFSQAGPSNRETPTWERMLSPVKNRIEAISKEDFDSPGKRNELATIGFLCETVETNLYSIWIRKHHHKDTDEQFEGGLYQSALKYIDELVDICAIWATKRFKAGSSDPEAPLDALSEQFDTDTPIWERMLSPVKNRIEEISKEDFDSPGKRNELATIGFLCETVETNLYSIWIRKHHHKDTDEQFEGGLYQSALKDIDEHVGKALTEIRKSNFKGQDVDPVCICAIWATKVRDCETGSHSTIRSTHTLDTAHSKNQRFKAGPSDPEAPLDVLLSEQL
ncbi:hypothetical protein MMC07_003150 [Pseudocyphellaria aurata]|nr:hypothetical protein [Pseudocyphellaria aurata]